MGIFNYVNKAFGYVFLLAGLIGCAAFVGFLFGFDISSNYAQYRIFGPMSEGGSSITPVFIAIITAAGAYLVKER